jgi:protein-L-isoaspartate(D-aspartate) O-methyltransferase
MYYDGDYAETPSNDPAFLYHNLLVAIDRERALNNGEPWFLARMIDALAVKTGERVVHIGTGTGYYTGILAELAGTEGKVIGVEIDSELAARARDNLSRYPQVEVTTASGTELRTENIDALFVNAGATHPLDCWLDALAPAGRLLLPLTARCRMGVVMKVTRSVSGFAACFVSQTGIFDCAGARDDRAGKRLADALDRGTWADVRSLRRDRHRRGPSCWLHGRGWCFSADPP